MALDVIAWTDEMRDQVFAALGPTRHWTMEQGRALWRPSTDGERWSRTLVVLDAGEPVAAVGAFHPRLHPANEWAYVEVAEARRRQGIATHAVAELRCALPDTARPLKAKVQAGTAGWEFTRRQGMTSIQRNRMIRVTGFAGEAPSTEVVVSSTFDDTAVRAWRDFYLNGHTWDAPADVDADVWWDVLAETQKIAMARRGDTVTGIALVLPHGGELRFAGGAILRDDPDAHRIAKDLLLGIAAALGRTELVVEVDDWMQEIDRALLDFTTEVLDEAQLVVEAGPDR